MCHSNIQTLNFILVKINNNNNRIIMYNQILLPRINRDSSCNDAYSGAWQA